MKQMIRAPLHGPVLAGLMIVALILGSLILYSIMHETKTDVEVEP